MDKIIKGEDKRIYLTVSQDGTLVNLNDFDNVLCFIVDSQNQVAAKFSRSTLADYIDMTQQGDNVLILNLKREVTKTLKRDTYKIEILTRKIDSDFPDKFNSIGVVPAFQVVNASNEAASI